MQKVPIRVQSAAHASEPKSEEDVAQETERAAGSSPELAELEQELAKWRDRALRLQAEMENYRKRQRRLVEEQIASSRELVLEALLEIADNLSRALDAREADVASLREGVEITLQSVSKALDREGVHPIQAEGQPFDPAQHEAVATVPYQTARAKPHTVVEVLEKGYWLDDRILRPARVIVAV
jgi:molecular chaperone GrpE